MFGLLACSLFVGFEPTITFLERRNRRTVLWSQGTHSTLETFSLKADKELQRIILSWKSGRWMALTVCRAVPIVLPRTAPQHMYTYVKCCRVTGPFHRSCVSTQRNNTNICVEMHTARFQLCCARYKAWLWQWLPACDAVYSGIRRHSKRHPQSALPCRVTVFC